MNEPETKDYLPVIPSPGGRLLPDWWLSQVGRKPFITSLDVENNPKARLMALNALNEESDSAKAYINREIEVTDYLCCPASTEDESGEISEFVRTILFCKDGRQISFGSFGVLKSIMLFESLGRKAPWNPPLKVTLTVRDLRNGRQWYSLKPDMKSLEARPSSK